MDTYLLRILKYKLISEWCNKCLIKFECLTVLLPSRWTWDVLCWGDRLSAGFSNVLRQLLMSMILGGTCDYHPKCLSVIRSVTDFYHLSVLFSFTTELYIPLFITKGCWTLPSQIIFVVSWFKDRSVVSQKRIDQVNYNWEVRFLNSASYIICIWKNSLLCSAPYRRSLA